MAKGHIRFAPDILRRLGEELNPHPDQGLIELAKNAYDADARRCVIELIDTDQPGGSIVVADDGVGMTLHEIQNGWLVLGRSGKSSGEKTALGRIPAGNKGLGRLAALRLGASVTLETRSNTHPTRLYQVKIDWQQFNTARLVEDVELPISMRTQSRRSSGTRITMEGLTSSIGRVQVKRLARALVLLADPFGDDPAGFSPVLKVPEFSDLERLVAARYFEHADYHLRAKVDRRGRSSAEVLDWRGKRLFSASHSRISAPRDGEPYRCPPVTFDLWIYLLTAEAFRLRPVSVAEVRTWLGSFGGVHLYVNGLRVEPYGNPGNDWLDINLRRAQSPEERPSTNTLIGRISATDVEDALLQKTDRSGMIETPSFAELRLFAQDSMEWLANRRMGVAEKRRRSQKKRTTRGVERSRERLEDEISKTKGDTRDELEAALAAYDRARQREVDALAKEVQLYRTLSTAGITAATYAHESQGNPVKVIGQSIAALERRTRKLMREDYDNQLAEPIEGIRRAVSSLSFLSAATLRLIDHEKRRVGRVDLHEVISDIFDTFKPFFDGRHVKARLLLVKADPFLRGTDAAMESIITNLLNNSLVAFEYADSKRREIVIETDVVSETFFLDVSDSGPGIQGISLADIWLPGQTTRPNGTGLGLTIVRDAVADLGGTVSAQARGDLGGASFRVELPILGS